MRMFGNIIKNMICIALIISLTTLFVSCGHNMPPTEKEIVSFFRNYTNSLYEIEPMEFIYLVRSDPDLFTIDLRKSQAYAGGHVRYALSIPWGTALWANIDKIPINKQIVVYSDSADITMLATALLAIAGYRVKGVMADWADGIVTIEDFDQVLETSANRFNQVPPPDLSAGLRISIRRFFEDMDAYAYSMFEDFTLLYEDAVFMFENEEEDKQFVCIGHAADQTLPFADDAIGMPFGSEMYKEFHSLPIDKYLLVYGANQLETAFAVVWLRLFGYDAILVQVPMSDES